MSARSAASPSPWRRTPTEQPVLAHLSVCSACGENYLAVVHEDLDRSRVETFDYYLDREPALRRVRGYEPRGRFGEPTEVATLFFVGDEAVSEATWREALAGLRAVASALVPERSLAMRRLPERLSAAVVDRCRAWWARQAATGRVPLGRVPSALLAPPPSDTSSAHLAA